MKQTKVYGKAFSSIELASFCGQIALILKSGISALEGLNIMLEDTFSPEEEPLLQALIENMQETGNLYLALNDTNLFPSYMIHMVQIGEETGTLDEVMAALETHYEREAAVRKSIQSAFTYPLLMTGMMVAVIIVLLVKVMPIFNQVFVQLGTEMTGFSRVLMNMGTAINRYSIVFTAILVLAAILIFCGTHTQSGRNLCRNLGYKFSFAKAVYEELASCRFASGMALTLSSGLNPERSMELVEALNDDPFFQKKLDDCRQHISEGKDLTDALFASGIFTGMYARMASIGSKTGAMDQVMDTIASLYQDNLDNRMNNILATLEPTLVILLSLIVGVILLSVMLPLMGIMSSI